MRTTSGGTQPPNKLLTVGTRQVVYRNILRERLLRRESPPSETPPVKPKTFENAPGVIVYISLLLFRPPTSELAPGCSCFAYLLCHPGRVFTEKSKACIPAKLLLSLSLLSLSLSLFLRLWKYHLRYRPLKTPRGVRFHQKHLCAPGGIVEGYCGTWQTSHVTSYGRNVSASTFWLKLVT